MNTLAAQNDTNLRMASVMVPDTNERPSTPSILPERFSSTSQPAKISIVPPELGSVTEPQLPPEVPRPERAR